MHAWQHYVCHFIRMYWQKKTMAIIGYARTSTRDQEAGLQAQIRDLIAAGCAARKFGWWLTAPAGSVALSGALRAGRSGAPVTTPPRAPSMTDAARVFRGFGLVGVLIISSEPFRPRL